MSKMKINPILLTGEQMRRAEKRAIGAGLVSGLELMERAGEGVVRMILDHWSELTEGQGRRVAILCGPGNNGGDGFVVARLLKARGWQVDLGLAGAPEKLPPDAKSNYIQWISLGGILDLADVQERVEQGTRYDVAVDALFGTGLTRPVGADLLGVLKGVMDASERTVAIDIASGTCADSGRFLGAEDPCGIDLAVTFQTMKPGHVLAEGGASVRAIRTVDIGIRTYVDQLKDELGNEIATLDEVAAAINATAQKGVTGHKYRHGHALVLAGPAGHTGAARLAARAALRVGAGLVSIGVPSGAEAEISAQITALMMRPVDGADALSIVLEDPRVCALCLGPGMGVGDTTRACVDVAQGAGRSVVLDADALTAFADDPAALFSLTEGKETVLTPHMGEFARLFPDLADMLQGVVERGPAPSRIDAVRAAAVRAGCVVLLKGPDTVIAAPDGQVTVHAALRERSAPWLATAGAGDVLAGLITGLMARGFGAMDAAASAAWLHVEAARFFGPGLIAEDLPEVLPAVLRKLSDKSEVE